MEEKVGIFVVASVIGVPIGAAIASKYPRILNLVFCALVFGTTQTSELFGLPTDINFLSREWYRGTTRGIEVSYLDLLALILLLGSLAVRSREGVKYVRPPSYGVLKIYFFWALVTVLLVSEPKIFGLFELTKIFRGILIFLAVYAFMRTSDQVRLFVYMIIVVVFYEAMVALHDRYVLGIHRVYGTLSHPNSLSMYCLQVFPIMISLWFAPDISSQLRKACLIAALLIAGVIILTISRTGFAALVVLTFLSIYINVQGRWTPRHVGMLTLIAVVGFLMVMKSWDTLSSRYVHFEFDNEYMSEEGDRGSYFRKGMPALADNPLFGIGLNNWSYWISNRYAEEAGYESEPYPSIDFAPDVIRQEAPAHNLYLITAVELGLIGFLLFVALIGRWLYISGIGFKKSSGDFLDRVRLGAFLSLCGVLMQSATEWEFRQTAMFFLGHIIMGVAAFIYTAREEIYRK